MFPEIYDLLCRLGLTANYLGFVHTAYAVMLCVEQPDRLHLVTKWLYPEVARRHQTSWKSVERNIRTAGSIIWRENRPLLERLARCRLAEKPRNAQLLAILAAAIADRLLANEGAEGLKVPTSPHPACLRQTASGVPRGCARCLCLFAWPDERLGR